MALPAISQRLQLFGFLRQLCGFLVSSLTDGLSWPAVQVGWSTRKSLGSSVFFFSISNGVIVPGYPDILTETAARSSSDGVFFTLPSVNAKILS